MKLHTTVKSLAINTPQPITTLKTPASPPGPAGRASTLGPRCKSRRQKGSTVPPSSAPHGPEAAAALSPPHRVRADPGPASTLPAAASARRGGDERSPGTMRLPARPRLTRRQFQRPGAAPRGCRPLPGQDAHRAAPRRHRRPREEEADAKMGVTSPAAARQPLSPPAPGHAARATQPRRAAPHPLPFLFRVRRP
ncbi:lysine-rich arabinogalactan protein 19-like [Strigops habroptila]|uniref:lysine-rich arabinogalactan protein 19-like n=1 Tax=Strigops habroptila TaxID=2489341 RepID=UPI0011CF7776|nr:lysine-rich arabinogalactan protein 19-like [Strigops habroptila]